MKGRVNFFRDKSASGMTFRKMGVISLALLGLFIVASTLQAYRVKRAVSQFANLEAELHRLKVIEGLEGPKSGMAANPAEAVLISLLNEPAWAEVLRTVPRSLPEGIWVESILGEAAEGKIVVEGTAYQARLVPGFIDRLRSHGVFSKVNLVSSVAVSKEPQTPLRFKIQASPKNR